MRAEEKFVWFAVGFFAGCVFIILAVIIIVLIKLPGWIA